MRRKVLAWLLTLSMVFTMMPYSAFATDVVDSGSVTPATISDEVVVEDQQTTDETTAEVEAEATEEQTETQPAVVAEETPVAETTEAVAAISEDATQDEESNVESGTWGGIDWTLTKDGTLTIAPTAGTPVPDPNSGKDFEVGAWRETVVYNANGEGVAVGGNPYDMNKVKTLVIKEGVTSIGSFTAKFPNLTGEVTIPSTVKYIGQEAFQKTPMTKLTFAEGGSEELCLAPGAFKGLIIEEVALPADRDVHLHAWVFQGCSNLKKVTWPDNVYIVPGSSHVEYWKGGNAHTGSSYDVSIFADDTNLETITFGSETARNQLLNGYNLRFDVEAYNGLVVYGDLDAAIAAAEPGDTITLLKDTDESIELPEGVKLDNNGKTADNIIATIAKIGDQKFETLQAAVNAVVDGDTITLLCSVDENVTVEQKENVKITIDGNNNTISGTITVDGKSAAYETAGVIIKNVNFDAAGITTDACINMGVEGNTETRYTNNVTVENCTFTNGNREKVAVKSYTGGDKNLTVTGCSVDTTMHSLLQLDNVTGVVVDKCTVNSKNGINLNSSSNVEIKNSTIEVSGYAVRMGVSGGTSGKVTLTENTLKTDNTEGDAVVVVRGTAAEQVELTMTENVVSGATHISGTTADTVISANKNYWDGATPVVSGTEVKVNTYYTDAALTKLQKVVYGLEGSGTEEDPYLINDVDELIWFRDSVNTYKSDGSNQYKGKYIKLNADIDLAGIDWNPIGSNSVGDHQNFLGTFDGDGHTISNLNIVKAADHLGFFARAGNYNEAEKAVVKNITFNNVTVKSTITTGHGGSYVGGVIANAGGNSTVENVHITGTIDIEGYGYVGGIVGHGYPKMKDCSVDGEGTIKSNYWCCGALVGYAGEGGTVITNSSVKGVTVESALGGVGAAVGLLNAGNKCTNVSATNVNVKSNSDYVVGYVFGNGEESTLTGISASNVKATVNGTLPTITDAVAEVNGTIYFNLQDAINAGGEVKVLRDINLADSLTIEKGNTVTLNLNGKTISQTKNCTENYNMILNKGNLTITGNGKISFEDTGAGDAAATWGSYTLRNEGTLVVENGTIENLSAQNVKGEAFAHTALAIFQYSGSTTINGGKISTPNYRSVRLWKGEMTINGGTFEGQVWVQCVDDTAKLEINGGEFAPTWNDGSSVFVNNSGYDSALSVTGGTFETKIGANDANALAGAITRGTFSEAAVNGTNAVLLAKGYVFGEPNEEGYYSLEKGLKGKGTEEAPYLINTVEDLIFFRDSVNAGETKYNAPGVYVALNADIDMSDATWERGIGDGINATYDGIFDGQNHTIKNLNLAPIADSDKYFCGGLFGYTYGAAVIKNMTLENITVTAEGEGHNVGALVGFANNNGGKLNVSGITVKNVTIDAPNAYGVATIVGYSYRAMGTIENCNVEDATINGYSFVGGITGYSYSNAVITGCSVKDATITATSKGAGGIAGIILGGNKVTGNTVDAKSVTVTATTNYASVVGEVAADGVVVENNTAAEPQVGGSYETGEPVQAKIGNKYYRTLTAAIEAAQAGDVVALANDFELTKTVEIPKDKTITLDLNGKTITGTDNNEKGNFYLFDNRGNLTVTGKGKITLTATVDREWSSSSVVIANNPGGNLTIESGTIQHLGGTAMAYAIDNLTNGQGTVAKTTINGGKIKSTYRAVRQFLNGIEPAQNILTINGGVIEGANKSVWMQDPSKNANTGTLTVTEDASLIGDVYLSVTAGSTEWPVELSIAAAALTGSSKVATTELPVGYKVEEVNGVYGVDFVKDAKVELNDEFYASLQDAINAAKAGETIKLVADIELTEGVTVPKIETAALFKFLRSNNNEGITIDLNGYDITGTDNNETGNFYLFDNRGTLTISDSVGEGVITLVATVDRDWNSSSVVIANNPGGKLTIESGTIEHLGGTDMAYGVDNLTNGKGTYAETIINGGTIKSTYRAVRQFLNGVEAQNILTINGGTIEGANKSVWMQDPSAKANTGTLTVGENATLKGDVYLFVTAGSTEWPVAVSIAAAALAEDYEVMSANVPAGYDVVETDGVYGVVETFEATIDDVKYPTLDEAFAAAQDGDTVKLLNDVAVDSETYTIADGLSITLDMNGNKITVKDNKTSNYELFYIYGEMTVTGNGTIELTATNNRGWNAMSTIFHNRGGVLTIENGTYKNLGGTDMAWVVDNSGNWYGDATTNINGGTLDSTYTAIRNRMEENTHGASGKAILNVTDGTINGTTSAIWAQAASTSTTAPATGEINISGGKVGLINTARSAGAVSMTTISGGTVAAFKGEVGELKVTDGTLSNVTIMNAAGEEVPYTITPEGLYVAAVAQIGKTSYATLQEALKTLTSGATLELLTNVTITEDWDARYTGAKVTVPVTIDGNGHTIKFTKSVNDKNYQAAFRFEAAATVTDLTIDMSEVTDSKFRAISAKGNLTVDQCTFIGKDPSLNCRAIIFGEGAGATIGDVEVSVTNSVFKNWKRGVTDNENAQDAKAVTVTGNTFTNANAYVSAAGTVVFNNNTMENSWANIRSYSTPNILSVTAQGNTLTANTDSNKNIAKAATADVQEGFIVSTPVASVAGQTYFSLNDAIAAAQDGETVTLTDDIDLGWNDAVKAGDYPVLAKVEGKSITLDMNGKTITVDHQSTTERIYAVVCVADGAGLTVTGNGTIDVNVDDNTPKVVYMFWKRGTTGTLTIENGNYHMDNSEDSMVYTNGDDIVTVNGGTFVLDAVGTRVNGFPCIFNTQGNGERQILVNGGTFNNDINHQHWAHETKIADGKAVKDNGDGTWTLVDAVAYAQEVDNGYVRNVGYATLAEAISAVENEGTVTLLKDITVDSETYTIADGKSLTLDMNGKKITVTDNKTSNYELFYIYGEMTVTGNGTIELTATNNREWNAMSAIFHNRGGVLTIENGTFTHNGGTDMAYVVDNSGNYYGDATTTIKGGTLTSTYIAVRNRMEQNTHGASGTAILNVEAGTITGTSRAIWAQAASTSTTAPATGVINVSGGEVGLIDTARSAGAESMTTISGGTVAAVKCEIRELTVTGGAVGTVTTLTADGNEIAYVVDNNGLYVEASVQIGTTNYATLAEAIAAVKDGETITLLAANDEDVIIKQAKNVSFIIDGNGNTYTGTITIDGNKRSTGKETLTIQNMNFVADKAGQAFISTVKSTLAHNVTVTGCTFTGDEDKTAYGMYLRHAYNISVVGCTATNMLDVAYGNTAVTGFTADNVTVTNSVNGFWLSYPNGVVIKNVDLDVSNVGVGLYNNSANSATFENCTIKADTPVYLEQKTEKAYTVTFDGTNNFTAADDSAWLKVIATDAMFKAVINDASLVGEDAIGMVAKIDNVYYNTVANAIKDATDTVTLVDTVTGTVTVNKAVNVDVNGQDVTSAEFVLANVGATVTGNAGLAVVNGVEDVNEYAVVYKDGVYSLEMAVAQINNVNYSDLQVALDTAKANADNKVVKLIANFEVDANAVVVPFGVTLDLKGHYVTVDNLLSFGNVIDQATEVGGIVISNDTKEAFVQLQEDNTYLPIYDTTYDYAVEGEESTVDGCYRFFEYELVSLGFKSAGENSVKYGVALNLKNVEGYNVLSNTTDTKLNVSVDLSWTGLTDGLTVNYAFKPETIKTFGTNKAANPTKTYGLTLTISGLDNLEAPAEVKAQPIVGTESGVKTSLDEVAYSK